MNKLEIEYEDGTKEAISFKQGAMKLSIPILGLPYKHPLYPPEFVEAMRHHEALKEFSTKNLEERQFLGNCTQCHARIFLGDDHACTKASETPPD